MVILSPIDLPLFAKSPVISDLMACVQWPILALLVFSGEEVSYEKVV
jgi:hypothetical protein